MKICVIPAFNEQKKIAKVIESVKKYFDEVVVVDDGSGDKTGHEATRAGALVLSHVLNRGQGAALATGTEYAKRKGASVVVHFDADGQFSSDDIPAVLGVLEDNEADIVFGSRFLEKKSKIPWLKENFIFPVARAISRIILKVNLSDPQSGFRGLGKKALAEIKIEQDGAAHCTEILYKAVRSGLRIKEVPIVVRYFDFGQSLFSGRGRGQGGVRILRDLLIAKLID